MTRKYRKYDEWDDPNRAEDGAWRYAEDTYHERLYALTPSALARTTIEFLDEVEDVGDAIVLATWCGWMANDHPEAMIADLPAFFDRMIEAVEGGSGYAGFVAAQGLKAVEVGTERPSWRDFCAWVMYACALDRALLAG